MRTKMGLGGLPLGPFWQMHYVFAANPAKWAYPLAILAKSSCEATSSNRPNQSGSC